MCNVWKNPTDPADEISLKTLEKIPAGIDNLHITGGEPTLREDLVDMVELLYPKAKKLEISSNGLHAKRLEPIIRKHPDIKVRFSLEGFEATNNSIRGEEDGFNQKVQGLKRLKELGGKDLGFGMVIQDDNIKDLVALYRMTEEMGVELATSALHNGYQFHKDDNFPYDRIRISREIEQLIIAMLKTSSVKNWFRAYMNLGLMEKVLGHSRLMSCTAASDFVFVDPWSDVYACNVRSDLRIGNLEKQSWDEIFHSAEIKLVCQKVSQCAQSCWMVGSARSAMRNPRFITLPKVKPLHWVLINKTKVMLGLPINFNQYVDYDHVVQDASVPQRFSHLHERGIKRTLQHKDEQHYSRFGKYNNH
jgi:MoaA/NifB/PqqE/SkfB family radical SAM enzyme